MSMPDFDKVLKGDFNTAEKAYNRLYNVVSILRSENGCPWDREQTPMSMRRDLIEETFETVDAITQNDSEHAKEELGDVLLNATMISYMYEQKGDFTLAQVLNELSEKLIRRHPHVFPESEGSVFNLHVGRTHFVGTENFDFLAFAGFAHEMQFEHRGNAKFQVGSTEYVQGEFHVFDVVHVV